MIAWRAVVAATDAPAFTHHNATGLWLGPDAHVVHYPVQQGEAVNIIAITRWTGDGKPPHGWMDTSRRSNPADSFEKWCQPVRDLTGLDAQWGGWPIHAVKRVGSLTQGKLCLIGDAAHPMVPFAAQGGASAIEDAAVLAKLCAGADNLEQAFGEFAQSRRDRVQKVMALSANNRRIYHLPYPLSHIRNLAMRFAPQEAMQRRMDWLYGWEA